MYKSSVAANSLAVNVAAIGIAALSLGLFSGGASAQFMGFVGPDAGGYGYQPSYRSAYDGDYGRRPSPNPRADRAEALPWHADEGSRQHWSRGGTYEPFANGGRYDRQYGVPAREQAGNPREWDHVTSRQLVAFERGYRPGTIVVSFSDRKLYYVTAPGQALSYLIGVPVLDEKWSGELAVSDKQVDPRWIPTADMRRKDPTLPVEVPGGHPRNPLGRYALYLGDTYYRIHGTDAPWTVGYEVSNGCIRLYNRDIVDLYQRVPLGTKVVVTYDSFARVAALPDRSVTGAVPNGEVLPWHATTRVYSRAR